MSEKIEIEKVLGLAKPVIQLERGQLVALHQDYSVIAAEKFMDARFRPHGEFTTPTFNDFKDFVVAEGSKNTPIFVNQNDVKAIAVLNFHGDEKTQGHCDYLASLCLESTVVWKKLNQLKDHKLDQRNFAVFIEDWAQVLNAFDENNNVIDIKDALVAVRNMQIEASTTSNAEVENTRQVQSEMAQIAASAKKGVLPAYFTIQDSAYLGLAEREIKLRLIVNSTGSTPQFAIQIVKEELLRNEIIEDFKKEVIALLPENPVRIGSFKS
ncbi:DUF2303 family protein [Acinetobacter pittii]|uniref:DUF2303 family protein n=1 Tax=Acinetobacter pittii TaxID=48296 RepID=UPI002A0757CA|nr:DUF2303 family protein [Acinetobacter pittii]MDX8161808.1 DUF2303 family protein [Acinetobacter pittii]